MKRLKNMRLINWHYFTDETLEFGAQTLITGKNGAGKSTIIDALQVLFVADQRYIRFNPAAHDEAKRTLINYLKGKIGNDERTFVRDGDFTSYIMCEFIDEGKRESFSVGVVTDVYRDNNYDQEYFILADKKLDELDLQKSSGHLRNREEFRRLYHQGNRTNSIFERQKSNYQKALLSRFGQLHERFFHIFTKALSFKPIDNIRDFVYDYILDKRELQLDVMRENFDIHEKYQRELREMEVRRERLRQIRDTFDRYAKFRETVQQQDYVVRRLKYVESLEKVEQTRQKKASLEQQIEQLEQQIKLAEQKKNDAREEANRVFEQWQAHQAEVRKKALEKKLAEYMEQEKRLREHLEMLQKQMKKEWQLLEDLCHAADALSFDETLLSQMQEDREFVGALVNRVVKQTESVDETFFSEVDADRLGEIGQRLSQQYETIVKDVSRLEDEDGKWQESIAELEKVIARLEKKQRTYPDGVQRLKKLLEDKLGSPSPIWVFCEEMELEDEQWRNAIEGYLNTQRFDLLIKPHMFSQALRLYEQHKHELRLEGVGLVDTEKEQRFLGSTQPHSLADSLQTENKVIQAHIDHLLGKVIKARDEQDLRKHKTAVTDSCMVYQRLTARQMHAHRYEIPFIGSKAIVRQLEIKRAELEEAKLKWQQVQKRVQQFQKWSARMQEKQSAYQRLADHLDLPEQLANCLQQKRAIEEELSALDLSEALKLKAFYEELRQTEKDWDAKLHAYGNDRAGKASDLNHVSSELYVQENRAGERNREWELWSETYGSAAEEQALQRWEETEKQDIPVYQKIANMERNWKANQTKRDDQFREVVKLRGQYNTEYHFSSVVEDESNNAFDHLLHDIESLNIPEFQEKVQKALAESEEEFKSHFVYKLKEAIEMAKREFHELNYALRHFPFSDDRYHFEVKASEKYKKFYDAVMDPNLIEEGSLFDIPGESDDRAAVLQELFEMLVRGEEGDLEEFTDYRRYLDFDILVTSGENRYKFSKVLREKSGGETQTPFYIAILASFHHMYHSNNTIRLVVFDEAFNKMDEQRIQTSLRLIKQMGLQLVAAVPDEKMQHMMPEVSTTLVVTNRDYRCFIDMIDVDLDETMTRLEMSAVE